MLGTCDCGKPVASKGLTCDSCIGEAHRPKPRRRGKVLTPQEAQTIARTVLAEQREPSAEDNARAGRDAEGRNANGGLKYSASKLRPSLFPVLPYWEIVKVLTFGANKYTKDGVDGGDNWQKNSAREYLDAAERHVAEWKMGRTADPESGAHPLGHACCDLVFCLWFELTGNGVKW